MQFLIVAYDSREEGTYERRMAVRPLHLENMAKARAVGSVICAGGMLDEEGKLKGSTLVMELPDRAAVDAYLETEPYVVHRVWEDIRVERFNTVILDEGPLRK